MINCLLEQLSQRGDTIFTYKNKVYNLKQKLSDLHTAQSNSNTYFRGRYKNNKNQSGSQFHDNTSFNKSFNTEVSIDDAISPYSEPTKELVISSHKNMNNDNNSKSVENNIREFDLDTTVIIVDDTNKINDSEKRTKENQTGKAVVNKNKQKVFILADSIAKHIRGWEITKKLETIFWLQSQLHEGLREAKNNPDHIIFDVGTNDIPSEKTPQVMAQSIVDLAKTVANDSLQVTVPSIAPRNDQWSKKVYEVNKVLLNLCKDVNIPFISHSATEVKGNLNNSKLHLNIRGSRKLQENFVSI